MDTDVRNRKRLGGFVIPRLRVIVTQYPEMLEMVEDGINDNRVIDLNNSTWDGVESQPFDEDEGSKLVGADDDSGSTLDPPVVGMVFSSWEAVDKYYLTYGEQQGFGVVRTSTSYKHKDGKSTNVKRNGLWRCDCWGKPDRRRTINGK